MANEQVLVLVAKVIHEQKPLTQEEEEIALQQAILKELSEFPDLEAKYISLDEGFVSVSFLFPRDGGLPYLKGISTALKTMFDHEPTDPGLIAAQLAAGARYWYDKQLKPIEDNESAPR